MPNSREKWIASNVDVDRALTLFSEGKTNIEVARELGITTAILMRWRSEDTNFEKQVARAQVMGFEVLADQLHTVHDDVPDVQKAKLKSDNIKWLLARRAAAKYGDRLDITLTQTVDIAGALDEARKRVRSIRDLDDIEDAELVETPRLNSADVTGCEPVSPDPSLEDLLK